MGPSVGHGGAKGQVRKTCLRRRSAVVAACALLAAACGCGPKRMQVDFRGYESAYANTSNRQLLLNLARLENSDPAYFFKLGQITSSYRAQASLSTNGQLSSSSGAVQIPTGGGSPGIIYENDPTFQFIPVNDDTNARLLLEPIQPETFYALYQQGWRLDQLFRLLVDRIEITRPIDIRDANGNVIRHDCGVQVIRNAPPVSLEGIQDSPERSDALSEYVTFLRVSALVYELQRQGHLILGGSETLEPYASNSAISEPGGAGKALLAKDQNDAVAKDNVWVQSGTGWVLEHKVFRPEFFLTPKKTLVDPTTHATVLVPDLEAIKMDVSRLTELSSGVALDHALQVLSFGFSIENGQSQEQTEQAVCSAVTGGAAAGGPPKMSARLVMRSMIGLMAAAAQEQRMFDQLMKYTEPIPQSHYDEDKKAVPAPFKQEVPPIEQEPLLRLTWTEDYKPADMLIRVSYRGADYEIADLAASGESAPQPENVHWNRDVFRLINSLTSQVTVDISKFPLPEILQLHSD